MPFDARVYRLLIASPGDVEAERQEIRRLAHRWNSANSTRRGIVLLPLGWELDSTPDMSAPGQEVINKELVAEADILVAVFWNRIGTPTGRFESGTVEEIEDHLESGKKAMIYFSAKAIPREMLDHEQLDGVERFKKRCVARGLVGQPYASLARFVEIFQHDLDKELNKARYDAPADVAQDASPQISLSAEGRKLLESAVEGDGRVLIQDMLSGWRVTAGEIQLFQGNDQRGISRWKAAVAENQRSGFLTYGEKDTYLEITDDGYHFVDELALTSPITLHAQTDNKSPSDVLIVRSSLPITVNKLTYATMDGYVAAERTFASTGREIRVPMDPKAALALLRAHRPGMAQDCSGPVKLNVHWTLGSREGTLVVPSQLQVGTTKDPNSSGLMAKHEIRGSVSSIDRP